MFMFPVAIPYGSYILPVHSGSVGGGINPGTGGGVIKINVSRALHLDGYIYAQGGDATDSDSGGGSGGSIHIVAMNFSGHGNVSTEGGRGIGYGCGGSGGRIAVQVLWVREFAGLYIAFGGYGGATTSDGSSGAGGTVYYTDSRGGFTSREYINTTDGIMYKDGFRKLYINNDNRNYDLPTVIESETGNVFEFDEIEARNHVVLEMLDPTAELIVHNFSGDRTGLFHLLAGQKLYVEYIESEVGYTVAPVSYKIDATAEIILPSTVILLGTRTEIRGMMTNVHNLTIAEGSVTEFFSTAQTALIENGTYAHMTDAGNVTIASITVQRGSVLELTHIESALTLHVDTFTIKYQGLVRLNKGKINSNTGVIESEGLLNLNHTGYLADNGPGAGGVNHNSTVGYGAGHGGHGSAPKPIVGGQAYGSLYEPTHLGSGGGSANGVGGQGGGTLLWNNGKDLLLDGTIAVMGDDGHDGNAGGGSGGSVLIRTLNFSGLWTN